MKAIVTETSLESELNEILAQCRFIPRHGARKFGTRFAIEFSGQNARAAKNGDLWLRIVPLVPLTSTPRELLDIVRESQRELTNDSNRGIAANAQRELGRLSETPLPAEVLQNRRIKLLQENGLTHHAVTDEYGEALFTNVELDSECTASVGDSAAEAPTPANVIPVTFHVKLADRASFNARFPVAMAAASGDETVGDEEERHFHRDPESGLSIEALLQPTRNGGTLLTLRSGDRGLAGAGIEIRIGDWQGILRISKKKQRSHFKANKTLKMPFSEARQARASFTIYPEPEK
jgi:hypothetical protein